MARFHNVYDAICVAVDGMPYEELGISQEDVEQVKSIQSSAQIGSFMVYKIQILDMNMIM